VSDGSERHDAHERDRERQSETSPHFPLPFSADAPFGERGLPLLNWMSRTVTVSRVTARVTGCG